MGVQVIEFKSQRQYNQWLQTKGNAIRVVNVSTTKRWSPWTGFLGDNKTYSVTYEEEAARAATPALRLEMRYCNRCGAAFHTGSRFCSSCGATVEPLQ